MKLRHWSTAVVLVLLMTLTIVGLVRTRNQIIKQDGTVVIVYTPLRMVKGRNYKGV